MQARLEEAIRRGGTVCVPVGAIAQSVADGFLAAMAVTRDSLLLSVEERRRRRVSMPGFWTRQTGNTYDRATAMMPHLLYERLDEIGTDFAIIYPTAGLRLPRIKDDATRRAVIRAYNIVSAEYFKDLKDRMTPAAVIPLTFVAANSSASSSAHPAIAE